MSCFGILDWVRGVQGADGVDVAFEYVFTTIHAGLLGGFAKIFPELIYRTLIYNRNFPLDCDAFNAKLRIE